MFLKRYPPFILQRYIFGELVLNLVFSLVVITAVFFIGMVIQSVYRYQNLPMTTILKVIPYFLPRALTFTIPLTVLIASVQTYGRLSSDNEITAVRVGGIHIYHLLSPVIFLGIMLSLLSVHFNGSIVPESIQQWKKITRSSFDQVLTSMRTGNHEIHLQRRDMTLTANEDGTFSNLLIVQPGFEGGENEKIMAKSAYVSIDAEDEKLYLNLEEGTFVRGGAFARFDRFPLAFTLSEQQKKVRRPQKEATLAELDYRLRRSDLEEYHADISTEYHKRLSLSLARFVFALLGAPMGILFRRGGRMAAFFVSFLVVLVVYYPLLLLGEAISADGKVPAALGMWLGNILIGSIGLVLVARIFRK